MTASKTTTPGPVSPRPKSNHAYSPVLPLSEFHNLGDGILFFDPAAASPQNHDGNHNHDNHPQPHSQLIVLCTWLGGATPRRIAKYTSGYRHLFPFSPILVIQTVIADFTVRSEQAIRRNLAPARDVIRDVLLLTRSRTASQSPHVEGRGEDHRSAPAENESHKTKRTGILLHIFSNGGCHLAVQLAHSYFSSYGHSLPVTLQILDSCPGAFSIAQTYGAAVHSVPSHHPGLLQSLERWGLWGAVVLIAGIQHGLPRAIGEDVVRRRLLGGVGVDFEGMRGEVLNDEVFGGGIGGGGSDGGQLEGNGKKCEEQEERTGGTGRLYLYSKADEVVGWRDVERHVGLARKLMQVKKKKKEEEEEEGGDENDDEKQGLVRAERFEKASHCALVMEDEERYWRAVRESWEGQMERKRRMRRESRSEEECGSGKVVLGAMNEQEGEGGRGEEAGTRSRVEEGVESRAAEALRRRGGTSKL